MSVILIFASPSDSIPVLESYIGDVNNTNSDVHIRESQRESVIIPEDHVEVGEMSIDDLKSNSPSKDSSEQLELTDNSSKQKLETENNQDKEQESMRQISEDSSVPLEYNLDGLAKSSQFPHYDHWEENHQANLAFFIQVSESNLPLVPRLIDRLWHEKNIIVLHIDAKVSEGLFNEFYKRYDGLEKYSNVHFLPRESITYMGVSMIVNTLNAIEYLLSHDQSWDYFINISGADYPCISATNLRIILGQPRVLKQGVSFVQLAPSDKFWNKMKTFRFDIQYADPALGMAPGSIVQTELLPTYIKHPLRDKLDVKFLQHEAWIIGHRKYVREAARGPYARKLLLLLSSAKDPEEHFFGMLGWNSPNLNKTMAHYAGRGVYWNINGVQSGQHPYTVDKNRDDGGNYDFWPRIQMKENLFVRKFSIPDSPLMDLIDKYKIGYGDDIDNAAVEDSFRKVLRMTMCQADIENNWYRPNIVPCFKNGNRG